MQLYNRIFNPCISELNTVDERILSSGKFEGVKEELKNMGYLLHNLSNKQICYLYSALNDIIFVVESTDKFYRATMCIQKIEDLYKHKCILEVEGGKSASSLISNLNKDCINLLLDESRFRLVKLNTIEEVSNRTFLCRLGYMSPYPDLKSSDVRVFSLTDLVNYTSYVLEQAMHSFVVLSVDSTAVICHNMRVPALNNLAISGTVSLYDVSDNVETFKLWSIKSIKPYSKSDFIVALLTGIVKYGNRYITLNRKLINDYYGQDLVLQKLESDGVRKRLCYEELMLTKRNSVAYYNTKYRLDYNVDDLIHLERCLVHDLEGTRKYESTIHARQLAPYNQIQYGKRSFYVTLKLSDVGDDWEKVEDIESVMPDMYIYYGVSEPMGMYGCVNVRATGIDSAKTIGKKEFERQFGEPSLFCSVRNLRTNENEGYFELKMTATDQSEILQKMMWGYVDNFKSYYKNILHILEMNNTKGVDENVVKLLFVNSVAKKVKKSEDIDKNKAICLQELVRFISSVLDGSYTGAFESACLEISRKYAKKVYDKLVANPSSYSEYNYERDGDCIIVHTDYAEISVTPRGVGNIVRLRYKGKFLCNEKF